MQSTANHQGTNDWARRGKSLLGLARGHHLPVQHIVVAWMPLRHPASCGVTTPGFASAGAFMAPCGLSFIGCLGSRPTSLSSRWRRCPPAHARSLGLTAPDGAANDPLTFAEQVGQKWRGHKKRCGIVRCLAGCVPDPRLRRDPSSILQCESGTHASEPLNRSLLTQTTERTSRGWCAVVVLPDGPDAAPVPPPGCRKSGALGSRVHEQG